MKIPLSKPSFDRKERKAVGKALKSGWVTSGPMVRKFESAFAEYVGARYAIATSSCTAALVAALKSAEVSGDHVAVPALTFAATAEAVVNAGLRPLIVDVNRHGLLDPLHIPPGTVDVLPVHLYGQKATGFDDFPPFVEDSAHRIERNQLKGNDSTVCFSFYATKNMTTGEGGMIATNDRVVAERCRTIIHHGIENNAYKRVKGDYTYMVNSVGFKGNMSDIQAAIGLEQLKKLPRMDERRREIVHRYNEAFGLSNSGLHLYTIIVDNRDEFFHKMSEDGIQVSVHYFPLHWFPAYKPYLANAAENADYIGKRTVTLPLYPGLTDKEVTYIIERTKHHARFSKA